MVTVRAAARRLGVSDSTLTQWICKGAVRPMRRTRALAALALVAAGAAAGRPVQHPLLVAGTRHQEYFVYVVSESADKIALVRFGPAGARVERDFTTGVMPADLDGPHGIVVSPDQQFYYVSLGHGKPFGSVWKYATKDDSVVGRVTLGMFPATLDVTPDGAFLYVVNFNLHGDMVPSSVSVVATEEMLEIKRIPTCTMPHGSRINPQGTRHYSACMMDDTLVEIDTRSFRVSRHFIVTRGHERGAMGAPAATAEGPTTAREAGHGLSALTPGDPSCSPTWAQPSFDGASVYVACSKSNEIVEIDVASWKVHRRLPAGPGVYNLAATRDGTRLVATNKRGQSVSVFDLKSGAELARIPTRRQVVHGVVVSRDDRYAFVSVEGVGAEPGTVETIDLQQLKTVASVEVGPQAAGIDVVK